MSLQNRKQATDRGTHPSDPNSQDDSRAYQTHAQFPATAWADVLAAVANPADPREPLEALCRIYWPPLYAFLRRKRYTPEDAKDVTQAFFAHLLQKEGLKEVNPSRGKFRTFLLACLTNFVANLEERNHAAKRGGGAVPIRLIENPEETVGYQAVDSEDPARAYERQWASTLVFRTMDLLGQKWARGGKSELFQVLSLWLSDGTERGAYGPVAARLGMSETAVRTTVSRLRAEYRILLRAEVGRTVGTPKEIDEELQYLLTVLQKK